MRFHKYQGLGNDFVVIDARGEGGLRPDPELARRLCDRRLGVGADGVLWVVEGPAMVVHNADGGRPEACGNGLRCVVRYLCDLGEWPAGEARQVNTDAGPRACTPLLDGTVRVGMGVATFPAVSGLGDHVAVDVGNPHRVCFVDANDAQTVAEEGPDLSAHPAFERGANVGFVRVEGSGLSLAVWERGVGPTPACGSGACAAAAAAVSRGLVAGRDLIVVQPGGGLVIDVGQAGADGGLPVTMTGPAASVFSGELTLAG